MRKIILILLILSILILAGCGSKIPQEKIDEFAQCLTEKGAVMYGAFWCPHCANVKKMFGSSFRYVDYVECDPRGENEQSELCIEKDIQAYATFEFADGSRLVGEPSFEELSQKTGCPVPA